MNFRRLKSLDILLMLQKSPTNQFMLVDLLPLQFPGSCRRAIDECDVLVPVPGPRPPPPWACDRRRAETTRYQRVKKCVLLKI